MAVRAAGAPAEHADRPLEIVDVRPSDCGYQALLWALREAERRDATVLAVTVWPGDPTAPDEGRAEMEQALTALVQRAGEETGVHGRTRVAVVASPVTAYEVAACLGADLVVVGAEEARS